MPSTMADIAARPPLSTVARHNILKEEERAEKRKKEREEVALTGGSRPSAPQAKVRGWQA
jgi:hypothetical protein